MRPASPPSAPLPVLLPLDSVMGMSFIFLLLAFKWAAGKYK
jgi:hypothetical protein